MNISNEIRSQVCEGITTAPEAPSIDGLLKRLDDVAREHWFKEYGLPMHDEGMAARLKLVVIEWLALRELKHGRKE